MLSSQPPPQAPRELQPDRASAGEPPSHGPATQGLSPPGAPEEDVTFVLRHEPYGPTTTLSVPRKTTFAEVRRLGIAKFKIAPAPTEKYLIARNGWVVDPALTVGELQLHELDFFSLGLKEDVYLCEDQLRALK